MKLSVEYREGDKTCSNEKQSDRGRNSQRDKSNKQ